MMPSLNRRYKSNRAIFFSRVRSLHQLYHGFLPAIRLGPSLLRLAVKLGAFSLVAFLTSLFLLHAAALLQCFGHVFKKVQDLFAFGVGQVNQVTGQLLFRQGQFVLFRKFSKDTRLPIVEHFPFASL